LIVEGSQIPRYNWCLLHQKNLNVKSKIQFGDVTWIKITTWLNKWHSLVHGHNHGGTKG
jgi:hypothetical protein